jgi:hypothetical protein
MYKLAHLKFDCLITCCQHEQIKLLKNLRFEKHLDSLSPSGGLEVRVRLAQVAFESVDLGSLDITQVKRMTVEVITRKDVIIDQRERTNTSPCQLFSNHAAHGTTANNSYMLVQ